MRPEVTARLKQLETTLTTIEKVMDPEALAARIRELEAQAGDPSLWDDPTYAQKVTSEPVSYTHLTLPTKRIV